MLDLVAASADGQGLGFWRHTTFFNFIFGNFDLPRSGYFHQVGISDVNHDGKMDVISTSKLGVHAFSGLEPS
ncbi:MAG TPA: hypothetical protein PLS31_12230, partial [Candidatus Sumerlaeota bacterium]|nr:hypothetical protein [Candidatus Sumerlaeota bacterium]